MRITLMEIKQSDRRTTMVIPAGETVHDTVVLDVNGREMSFKVSIRVRPLPGFDGSLVAGELPLEELLRYEPEALAHLYSKVGRVRRGQLAQLPELLVSHDDYIDGMGLEAVG